MIKEILIGIIIAATLYGLYMGFNLAPVLVMGFFFGIGYLLIKQKIGGDFFSIKSTSSSSDISFEQIGGQKTAKGELIEALQFIVDESKIKRLGIRPLKGILLTGPPGTGKTLLAKAAANFTNSAFISCSGSDFVEVYAGVGAQRIRQIFTKAKKEGSSKNKNGAIIFIDEIDVLGGKRGSHQSHMEYDQTLNQLLVEMDGIITVDSPRILVMAATNREEILDDALIRPGRFDRLVQVTLPDTNGRLEILKIHTKGKPVDTNVDLEAIAKDCFGFSGAHLESVVNEAAIMAFRDNCEEITNKHFSDAIEKVMMGEKVDRKPDNETLRRVAIHEVGHAIISESYIPDSVSGITVSPRGNALGYVRQSPTKDQYLYTVSQMEHQIAISLAGAIAEELVLGSKSTGAKGDFCRAINLSKEIIYSGLSSLGIVDKDTILPDKINGEVQRIIGKIEMDVKNILLRNLSKIYLLTDVLLEKEKLDGVEFRKYLFN
jgi:vesicle-fusing ATPase